ncbi:MAG: ABC transporter substrate-binding protein [Betaproteobacteria bacterium]
MSRTFLAALLSAVAFSACAQPLTKLRFTNDWRFEGHTSYLHMAKAKGYYEQEGLDVQIDSGTGSTVAIQRIASGAYEIGYGDLSALIEFMGNNPGPLLMQAVYMKYDQLPLVYTTLKKSNIQSIADFKGRQIAAGTFEVTRKLWPIVARAAKIDPGSVSFVTVDPTLRVNAVINGSAQICGGFLSVAMDWNQRGVKTEDITIHNPADLGLKLYGNAVFASVKLIAENPKAVAGFVRATNRAMKEGLADPAASVRYLKQRDPIIEEAVETQRFILMAPSMITDYTRANGLGGIDPQILARQVDQVSETFGAKVKPDATRLFNPAFLPPRAERIPPPLPR